MHRVSSIRIMYWINVSSIRIVSSKQYTSLVQFTKKKRALQKFKLEYTRTWPVLIESAKKGVHFERCNMCDIDILSKT